MYEVWCVYVSVCACVCVHRTLSTQWEPAAVGVMSSPQQRGITRDTQRRGGWGVVGPCHRTASPFFPSLAFFFDCVDPPLPAAFSSRRPCSPPSSRVVRAAHAGCDGTWRSTHGCDPSSHSYHALARGEGTRRGASSHSSLRRGDEASPR